MRKFIALAIALLTGGIAIASTTGLQTVLAALSHDGPRALTQN